MKKYEKGKASIQRHERFVEQMSNNSNDDIDSKSYNRGILSSDSGIAKTNFQC